jgi:hypothetical protein
MAVHAGPEIVEDGLILALDAANPRSYTGSGNTWFDLSRNSRNGTLMNSPTFSIANNGSLVFDGLNDYTDVSNTSSFSPSAATSFSISVWFNFTSALSWHGIFTKNRSLNQHFGLWLNNSIPIFGNAGGGNLSANTTLSSNRWYNVVCTQIGSTSRSIYINSNLAILSNVSYPSTGNENIQIGRASGVNEFFYGEISNVMFYYNRALTASEIRQNFEATRDRYGI